ncbi:MAG: D-alanine--D-alanine ligase [Bdellovibrionaceae bacterium]|nr:D-alanine--D-alanine ligase [Pseudobdellovibrionaceae bacterium]
MSSSSIRIALVFGGQSAEHAVSLESAKNVMEALDPKKYEVHLIAIDKNGTWRYIPDRAVLRQTDVTEPIDVSSVGGPVWLVPGPRGVEILALDTHKKLGDIDVVFPILHGPYGEDGTIQGYFRLMGVPFVGSGVLGSAVGMDKDFTKRVLRDAGVPIPKFVCLYRHKKQTHDFKNLKDELGLPFFLKPANMGSSVGVHKVSDETKFKAALADAFQYDTKVLVEEFVQGREIECSVLGNKDISASVPGEVLPQHEFYSYEAKYLDDNGAQLQIPAALSPQVTQATRDLALKVYEALHLEGMSRVDFFLAAGDRLLVNEVNTIPGFTKISMYPKMWNATGLTYTDLIDKLVQLAFERTAEDKSLRR